jgi:hypothetical protein
MYIALHGRHRPLTRCVPFASHQMIKVTKQSLIEQGRISAERYDSCDTALAQLNEGFGAEYESARSNLTSMLTKADNSGLDLDVFRGDDSLFKFPEFRTNIVVRIDRSPTPHAKIEKLNEKIADLERKLKIAKIERNSLIEQLHITGAIDLVTDKITAVFRRLK